MTTGFKQSGVELVVKGYNQFVSNLGGAAGAVDKFALRVTQASQRFNDINRAIANNTNQLRLYEQALKNAQERLTTLQTYQAGKKTKSPLDPITLANAQLAIDKANAALARQKGILESLGGKQYIAETQLGMAKEAQQANQALIEAEKSAARAKTFIGGLSNAINQVKSGLGQVGTSISSAFAGMLGGAKGMGAGAGTMVESFKSAVGNLKSVSSKAAQDVLLPFEGIPPKIGEALGKTGKYIDASFRPVVAQAIQQGNNLANAFGTKIAIPRTAIGNIQSLFNYIKSGVSDSVSKLSNFKNAFTGIGQVFGSAGKAASSFAQGVIGAFQGIGVAASGVINVVKVAAQGLAAAFNAVWTALSGPLAIIKTFFNILVSIGKVALTIVTGGINLLVGAFKSLLGIIQRIIQPFTDFAKRVIEIATGIALYDWIRSLQYAIKGLIGDIMTATAEFQLLEVRMRSIVARDIVKSGLAKNIVIPMEEAMGQATTATQNLLDWVKRIAVTTPFTANTLASVVTLASAMGMTVDQAQRLTLATGNLVAAFGLEDETMWRIIYNMGQMIQRGKLTGEEFRDLSRNFFPIYELLQEMGKEPKYMINGLERTTEAMKELAFSGGVPVMDFIDAFMRKMEKEYPNAMKNLGTTFKFLKQNVVDFFNVFVGVDIIKPSLDKLSGMVNEAFNAILSSKSFRLLTMSIGKLFEKSIDYLAPTFDKLASAIFPGIGKISSAWKDAENSVIGYSNNIQIVNGLTNALTIGTEEYKNKAVVVADATSRWADTMMEDFVGAESVLGGVERAMGRTASLTDATTMSAQLMGKSYKTSAEATAYLEKNMEGFKGLVESVKSGDLPGVIRSILVGIATVIVAIKRIAESIGNWFAKSGSKVFSTMAKIASKALEWGVRIMAMFAKGLAMGITLVVKVLSLIGALFSRWLKGRSPPKIAPFVDKWGADFIGEFAKGMTESDAINEAFSAVGEEVTASVGDIVGGAVDAVGDVSGNKPSIGSRTRRKKDGGGAGDEASAAGAGVLRSFMEGWKNAQFSIFNEVYGTVSSYLNSISAKLGKDAVPLLLAKIRINMAKAIQDVRTGAISMVDAIERMVNSIGYIKGDFRNYITALVEVKTLEDQVAEATKIAERAQNELNEVTKRYDRIIEGLQAQLVEYTEVYDESIRLKEIDAALSSGLLTDEEYAKLMNEKNALLIQQRIRVLEKQRDEESAGIQIRIDAAETARATAENELSFAQERLDMFKALIDAQIEQNELFNQMASDAAGSLGSATDQMEADLQGVGSAALGVGSDIQSMLDNIKFDEIFAEAETNFNNFLKTVQTTIGPAAKEFENLWSKLFGTPSGGGQLGGEDLSGSGGRYMTSDEAKGKAGGTKGLLQELSESFKTLWDTISKWTGAKDVLGLFEQALAAIGTVLWGSSASGYARTGESEGTMKILKPSTGVIGAIQTFIDIITGKVDISVAQGWIGDLVRSIGTIASAIQTVVTKWMQLKSLLGGLMTGSIPFTAVGGDPVFSLAYKTMMDQLKAQFPELFKAKGGDVWKDMPSIVGEMRPEVFVPKQNGSIIPSIEKFLALASRVQGGKVAAPAVSSGRYGNIRNVYVEVNPSYTHYQSEASVRFDVSAALVAANL